MDQIYKYYLFFCFQKLFSEPMLNSDTSMLVKSFDWMVLVITGFRTSQAKRQLLINFNIFEYVQKYVCKI